MTNNYSHFLRLVTLATLLLAGAVSGGIAPKMAPPQLLEGAAEVSSLKLSLDAAGNGVVYARECDQCPVQQLSIKPSTRFYVDDSQLHVGQLADFDGKGATVLFDPVTKIVTRIVYW